LPFSANFIFSKPEIWLIQQIYVRKCTRDTLGYSCCANRNTLPSEQSAGACARWSSEAVAKTTTTLQCSNSILSTKPVVDSIVVRRLLNWTNARAITTLLHRTDRASRWLDARDCRPAERWRGIGPRLPRFAYTSAAVADANAAFSAQSLLGVYKLRPELCVLRRRFAIDMTHVIKHLKKKLKCAKCTWRTTKYRNTRMRSESAYIRQVADALWEGHTLLKTRLSAPLFIWMGGMTYCSPRNVFDSCVKSWQYFRTDKILLETSLYWRFDDIVRFKIEMGF